MRRRGLLKEGKINYQWVDLGLSVKWATTNVGARTETDFGGYYRYGDGANEFQTMSGTSYYRGQEVPLASTADTATQVMGSPWRMPTSGECQELINNCTREVVDDFNGSGVSGYKYTSKKTGFTDKYVFFSNSGVYNSNGSNSYSAAWFYTSSKGNNIGLCWIAKLHWNTVSSDVRSYGCSIRGVRK